MSASPQKTDTQNRQEEKRGTGGAAATPFKVKQEGAVEQETTPVKLKGPIKQEVNTEEDSTPVKLMKAIQQEVEDKEVDYMEGITEDMFGDDDDFEREGLTPSKTVSPAVNHGAGCSSWGPHTSHTSPSKAAAHRSASRRLQLTTVEDEDCEGDSAEPLPDSRFGLLGVREGLLVPQGQLQDLPEEVLRQVFGLLPALDLYRSVQCVCRSWREMVADPKVRKRGYYVVERRIYISVKITR